MPASWNLNLIRFFDFYLAFVFLVSTFVRVRQYEAVVRLVRAVPDRWPRLLRLVRQHHMVFVTRATLLPAVLALSLFAANSFACRLVWPHANLTVDDLAQYWLAALPVGLLGAAMLALDAYATFRVGEVDRLLMERYFDQAEYWLRSWMAPVVNLFTLGFVNPRKMVREEVRTALVQTSELLNSTLWWVSAQVSLRIAFGLSIWLAWACLPR